MNQLCLRPGLTRTQLENSWRSSDFPQGLDPLKLCRTGPEYDVIEFLMTSASPNRSQQQYTHAMSRHIRCILCHGIILWFGFSISLNWWLWFHTDISHDTNTVLRHLWVRPLKQWTIFFEFHFPTLICLLTVQTTVLLPSYDADGGGGDADMWFTDGRC